MDFPKLDLDEDSFLDKWYEYGKTVPNTHSIFYFSHAEAVISSMIGKRLYVENDMGRIYSNLYNLVLADSTDGKSIALRHINQVLHPQDYPTSMYREAGVLSEEGKKVSNLVEFFRSAKTEDFTKSGLLTHLRDSFSVICLADELSGFLEELKNLRYQSGTQKLIDNLWNCPPSFEVKRSNPKNSFSVPNPYFVLDGTTILSEFIEAIPKGSKTSGSLYRNSFFLPNESLREVAPNLITSSHSLYSYTLKLANIYSELIQIQKPEQPAWEKGAYELFQSRFLDLKPNRVAEKVLKFCILFSAERGRISALNNKYMIYKRDVENAIKLGEYHQKTNKVVTDEFEGVRGVDSTQGIQNAVLRVIRDKGPLTPLRIVNRVRDLQKNPNQLTSVLRILEASGSITKVNTTGGRSVKYKYRNDTNDTRHI